MADRFAEALLAALGGGLRGYVSGSQYRDEREERERREEEERRWRDAQLALQQERAGFEGERLGLERGRYEADIYSRYDPAPEMGPHMPGYQPRELTGMEGQFVPKYEPTDVERLQGIMGAVREAGGPEGAEYLPGAQGGRWGYPPQAAGAGGMTIKTPSGAHYSQAWLMLYGASAEAEISGNVKAAGHTMEQASQRAKMLALQLANPMLAGMFEPEPGPPTEEELARAEAEQLQVFREIAEGLMTGDESAMTAFETLQAIDPEAAKMVLSLMGATGPAPTPMGETMKWLGGRATGGVGGEAWLSRMLSRGGGAG